MKPIAALVVLIICLLVAPIVAANPLESIPTGNWVYDALSDLIDAELIAYPVVPGEETLLSRYQAGLLIIQVLENNLAEHDPISRRQHQFATVAETLNHFSNQPVNIDLPASDPRIMRSFLSGLSPTVKYAINEAILADFFVPIAGAQMSHVEMVFKLINEFADEINTLGFPLTDVEIALMEMQHQFNQHFQLVTSLKRQSQAKRNNSFRLQVIGSYAPVSLAEYVLEFHTEVNRLLQHQQSQLSLMPVLENRQLSNNIRQNGAGLGDLPSRGLGLGFEVSQVFDNYRFINFKDINTASAPHLER